MRILGIETSCDETAVAITENGSTVLANVIASSQKEQARYGGVFPEMAARRQLECIVPALKQALDRASVHPRDLDAVAVTKGPGLLPSLLIGVSAARVFASRFSLPLMGVHHTLGHLDSPWLEPLEQKGRERAFSKEEPYPFTSEWVYQSPPQFPILALSVSGGHTELWLRESHAKGTLLGRTRDDAAGEAFDKGAVLLGLPYPGGPALSRLAEGGDSGIVHFPIPLQGQETCDMSFSGLKTSLKYLLRDIGGIEALSDDEKRDLAASYQEAICKHLVSRITQALEMHPEIQEVHLVGGVSANKRLRALLSEVLQSSRTRIRTPTQLEYCTDNAAMIAAAGYFMVKELGDRAFRPFEVDASGKLATF